MNIKRFQGYLNQGSEAKIALVCSRFNELVVQQLERGALETLERYGVQNVSLAYVDGAHEIPLVVKRFAESGKFDAVIALGAVIRGATPHFEVVVSESAKGLSQVALQTGIPIINGILTTNSIEQALERAGTKAGNKGADCARTALDMVSLLSQLP